MKIYLFILSLAALTLGSCSSYLDKAPENKIPTETLDYTAATMFQPLAGLYGVASQKISSWPNYGYMNVRGGDVDKGSTSGDQGALQSAKDLNYSAIRADWAFGVSWENYYKVVQTANSTIEALELYTPNMTTPEEVSLNAQYIAEARFIRAYAYFIITRLWGNVPLFTDNLSNEATVKAPRADIYAFIIAEMDASIPNMPYERPNMMNYGGQVTAYSALALKAKAAAEIMDWDNVLSATDKIINDGQFSLFPDFYQYFKKPGCLCDENLYEFQFSDFGSGTGILVQSDNWFAFQGPRAGFLTTDGQKIPEAGWGFMTPSQQLIDFMTARGETVRAQTTFLYTGSMTIDGDSVLPAAGGTPTVYDGKVYLPYNQMTEGRTQYGVGNNIRMIRYSDVLLLNAEAKINLGQNGDAPLNLVRERAGMPAITGATIDDLFDERRAEFACEWGERFFDLVRSGKAASEIPNFVVGESEFYPVPQAQIDLNPNLGL